MIGLRKLIRHKDEERVPIEALGFARGEIEKIHESLRKTYRTYGNLAKAFDVDLEDMTRCILLSKNPLETIALYTVKRGETGLSKKKFIALLMIINKLAEGLAKSLLEEENKVYL